MKKSKIFFSCFPFTKSKLLRLQRCTFILINVLYLLIFSSKIYAQEKKFTLNLQNAKIKDAFSVIESQSSYRFFYNAELTELNNIITVSVKDAKLEDILNRIFSGTNLTFTIIEKNNQIVIVL